jgi:hypothetical protein
LTPDSAPTHTDTVANDQTNRLDLLTYDPATDKGRIPVRQTLPVTYGGIRRPGGRC